MVKINYEHNHELLTTGAWNFLGISESTKARYSQLFAEGNTPSKARLIYVAELKEKLGEDLFFKESAKRSINPGSGTVFNMWTPKLLLCPSRSASHYLLKIVFVCIPFQKNFHFLFITLFLGIIAKDCFFTLVKSRLLLGSLVGQLVVSMPKMT